MNTIALATHTARPTSRGSALIDLLAHLLELREGARDGLEIQARYETYSRMSRAELAEFKMSSSDIYRAALIGRPV